MPSSRPTIYLIAGCNGAGKTTFAKEFLPSIGACRIRGAPARYLGVASSFGRLDVMRFLNADEIARGLSPLKPEAVAFKAGRLLLREFHELVERIETFVIDGSHDVPAEDIRRRFSRSIQHLLDDYAPLANKWFLWDNARPPAKLLAESAAHSIVELRMFFSSHEEKSV